MPRSRRAQARKRGRSVSRVAKTTSDTSSASSSPLVQEPTAPVEQWAHVETQLQAVAKQLDEGTPHPRVTAQQWMDIYAAVGRMFVSNDNGQKRILYRFMREYLSGYVREQLAHLESLTGAELLAEYMRRWRTCNAFVSFLKRVLHHMHRHWIPKHYRADSFDPVVPADRLLLMYWREELLSRFQGFVDHVLDLINEDRDGSESDASVVSAVLETFVQLGKLDVAEDFQKTQKGGTNPTIDFYESVFERPFLRRSSKYFAALSAHFVQQGRNQTDIVNDARNALDKEEARVVRLLIPHSVAAACAAAEHELVAVHMPFYAGYATDLITSIDKLDATKLAALQGVVNLIARIGGALDPLRESFRMSIVNEGQHLIETKLPAEEAGTQQREYSSMLPLIFALLQLHKRRLSVVTEALDGHSSFLMALNSAFQNIINHRSSVLERNLPVVLAQYADLVLRGEFAGMFENKEIPTTVGSKRQQDIRKPRRSLRLMKRTKAEALPIQVDETPCAEGTSSKDRQVIHMHIDHIVRLFVYLEDKDGFFDMYRQLMAKRLLKSYDDDIEAYFIERVEEEMGPVYTSKLDGMLKDIRLSEEIQIAFKVDLHAVDHSVKEEPVPVDEVVNVESHVQVLNSMYWPKFTGDEMRLPTAMQVVERSFERFFERSYFSRKVTWIRLQGHVELEAVHPNRTYNIAMSAVQGAAMMLFNASKELNVKSMAEQLNLDVDIVAANVEPLAQRRRTSLLRKKPRGERPCVCESHCSCDHYILNERFYSAMENFRVHSANVSRSAAEVTTVRRSLVVEHGTQLDAAIVKVMKAQRRLHMDELVKLSIEVVSSRFAATEEDVKRQMHNLIEREYILLDTNEDGFCLYSA